MDRNTIIGLVMIGVIMIIFSVYNSPSKDDLLKQHTQDSLAFVHHKDSLQKASSPKTTTLPDTSHGKKTIAPSQVQNQPSVPANIFTGSDTTKKEVFTTVENDKLKVTF